MSNLRIKNKKLKREIERLRNTVVEPKYIHTEANSIVKLRSEIACEAMFDDCLPVYERLAKRRLLEEVVSEYISIEYIEYPTHSPVPIMRAEIDVIRKE